MSYYYYSLIKFVFFNHGFIFKSKTIVGDGVADLSSIPQPLVAFFFGRVTVSGHGRYLLVPNQKFCKTPTHTCSSSYRHKNLQNNNISLMATAAGLKIKKKNK